MATWLIVVFFLLLLWACTATWLLSWAMEKVNEYRPKAEAYDKLVKNLPR